MFDVADECKGKPYAHEQNSTSPSTPSTSRVTSISDDDDNEHEESTDSMMSFDEQEELMSRKKKTLKRRLCGERRSVLKDLSNLKENAQPRTRYGKVERLWSYKDESGML